MNVYRHCPGQSVGVIDVTTLLANATDKIANQVMEQVAAIEFLRAKRARSTN